MLTPTGCRGRVARLCAALDSGLDGVLISRPEHVYYLSNLFPLPNSLNLDSSSFLLIRRNGSTTLFTDNWLAPSTQAAADEIIVVEWYSMRAPARDRRLAVANAVAGHLRGAGLRTLGAETAVLPTLIAKAAPDLVDIDGIIQSLREIKDPDELAALRLAIRAAEAVHAASRRLLVPGTREIDYYAALLAEATRAIERPFTMMCDLVSGERAVAGGGPPSTRVMVEGELVILDFFPAVEGYRADITNTLSVGGRPTPEQSDGFACVQAALRAGEHLLRPGARVAEVFEAMDRELQEAGASTSLAHHGGHGIGLGHPEAPHIVPKSERTLSAGMVVTLEPGLYGPSFGGIRLENDYLVTADGFERLSSQALGLV